MISTGREAPPETATRRLRAMRSTSTPSVSAPSRPQYIVGTPAKKVTLLLEQGDRLLRVEPGKQHQGRAHREAGVHLDRRAERVEERQGHEVHVGCRRPVAEHLVAGHRVEHEVGVGELGALGAAGGATGVEDHGGVRRLGDDRLERRRLAGDGLLERLDTVDGRRRAGSGTDDDEVLAVLGVREAGENPRGPSAAPASPRSRCTPWPRSR